MSQLSRSVAASDPVYPIKKSAYKSGEYYLPINFSNCMNTGGWAAADRIQLSPFIIHESISIDTLFVYGSTTGVGNIRLGVYNSDSDGMPSTVAFTAGTFVNSNAAIEVTFAAQTLTAGTYWLAAHHEDASAIRVLAGQNGVSNISLIEHGSNDLNSARPMGHVYYSQAYSSGLPDLTSVAPSVTAHNTLSGGFKIA